jgi:diaminopimelate decarboxylase
MTGFAYRDGRLFAEDLALTEVAERFGTPCFVYSRAALTAAFNEYAAALAGRNALVCFAVKANSNLAILDLFARLGAGFDIVSGGEMARVLAAGGLPGKIVFSGVGKRRDELEDALDVGVRCFNVESPSELARLDEVARAHGTRAPIALRVNPDVDPKTHPYISTGLKTAKFGVAIDDALDLYRRAAAMPGIAVSGIANHIGSQLLDPQPAADAVQKLVELADRLAAEGIAVDHLDLGGGKGIRYRDETALSVAEYLTPTLKVLAGRREQLMVEPGRSLVGNAGVLLTRVEVLKHGSERNFAVVDAAMNDLARPALYDAWHEIVPVAAGNSAPATYDVVGPICESGDFLGRGRELAVAEGDLLAVQSAGAYGMAMSSNYNSRPRAAEVMVDGDTPYLIRRREEVTELFAAEQLLP